MSEIEKFDDYLHYSDAALKQIKSPENKIIKQVSKRNKEEAQQDKSEAVKDVSKKTREDIATLSMLDSNRCF